MTGNRLLWVINSKSLGG